MDGDGKVIYNGWAGDDALADKAGNFQIRRESVPMFLYAVSPDKKLGVMIIVAPDQDNVTIRLAATAAAKGRLVDEHGKPVSGKTLQASMMPDNPEELGTGWSSIFNTEATSKADGTFTLEGLLPTHTYRLHWVEYLGAVPAPPEELGEFTPDAAKVIDLGNKTLSTVKTGAP